MKVARLFLLGCLALILSRPTVLASSEPYIKSIAVERTNILVRVAIQPGFKKITLQSRRRVLGSAWEPRAIARVSGTNNVEAIFTLPLSAKLELVRVQADAQEALPDAFYKGTNSFNGATGDASGVTVVPGPTADNRTGATETTSRAVVESDIWKISSNTLFFFNQYRGLQVIDLTKPDSPSVTSTLNLPAAGEQMYVVNEQYVALLARNGCGWGYDVNNSSIVLVDVRDKSSAKISSVLPVAGYIQESRMVGTALYVASQAYRPVVGRTNTWEWGTTVASFDLADPAQPKTMDTLWFAGYGNVIYATDRFLFISLYTPSNYLQSLIQVVDISEPNGAMKSVGSVKPSGQVGDKFKMNLSGDIFTTISQAWDEKRRWITRLETFSLATPASPVRRGSLELAAGEQLHATRFDGDQVYIVTFFRVDPLWIVDLSDASQPRITGELEVDGWSTYIQPLGQRLLAIGVDPTNGWRVTVSLFDVQNRAKPTLLSKVFLGQNSSWSEANYDEKAFGIFPSDGLFLVPYQGYTTNGYSGKVQLIDLTDSQLRLRGAIEHAFQPRRATLHKNHIYSISGKELITVDAADRDKPAVRADQDLSWTVNRLYLAGGYVLELDHGESWSWNGVARPAVRIARPEAADNVLTVAELARPFPIVGSAFKDGLLYIAQGERGWNYFLESDTTKPGANTNPPNFFLTVFDARNLPALPILGQESVSGDPVGWGSTLQALWPKPGLLVWAGGGGGYYPWVRGGIGDMAPVGRGIWAPWFSSGAGRLLAFDIKTPAAPKYLSAVSLSSNNWWNYSEAFAGDGLIFASHQSSEFLEGVLPPGQRPPEPVTTKDPDGNITTNQPPIGTWVQRYYLDVIDYADPKEPLVRKPVNIPGVLKSISHQGALLFTVAPHWDATMTTDWSEWLDASAYDGVAAHLVDSLPLKEWPHPLLFNEDNFLLGRNESTNNPARLESWKLSSNGKFTLQGTTAVKSSPQSLASFGSVVVAQGNSEYTFFNSPDLLTLQLLKIIPSDFCYYFDLRQGDANPELGFWAPLGDYGFKRFNFKSE